MPPTAFSPTEFLHRLRDAETLNSFLCCGRGYVIYAPFPLWIGCWGELDAT
jgi:hypothetical protein